VCIPVHRTVNDGADCGNSYALSCIGPALGLHDANDDDDLYSC